jgi:hypothetical protein
MLKPYIKPLLISLGIFLGILAAYMPLNMVRIMNQSDNFWYVPTAMSFLNQGNIELSEFEAPLLELSKDLKYLREYFGEDDYRIMRSEDGKVFNRYPLGVSMACVPIVAVLNVHYRHVENPLWAAICMSLIVAKLYAAATVAVFFLVVLKLSGSLRWSVGLSLVLAFASLNFGQHAGGMWSHNPAAFFVVLALLFLVSSNPRVIWLSALPLVISVTMRPDLILLIGVATLYILIHHREAFLKYALVGASGALIYVIVCKINYGAFTQPYPGPVKVLGRDFAGGLPGLLLSPSRGLLIYMPVCLFSIWGMVTVWRRSSDAILYRYLVLAVLAHWIFLAVWPMWWAGWSFGPRLFCSMIPLWVLLILPVRDQFRRVPVSLAATLVVAWSVFVEVRCVTDHDVHLWNGMPVDVNDHTERLWDWGDTQILRGLGGEYTVDLPRKRLPSDYQ